MSAAWPVPTPRDKLRVEREVELRLLYTVKHQVDPRIKELETILGEGGRGKG